MFARKQSLQAVDCAAIRIAAKVAAVNEAYSRVHPADDPRSWFSSASPPSMSVADYMLQVQLAGAHGLWPQVLILIDQLTRNIRLPFSPVSAHRLLVTGYLIALKLARDSTGTLRRVAHVGGVSVEELRSMEARFLDGLDWRVQTSPLAYIALCQKFCMAEAVADNAATSAACGGPITLIPAYVVPLEERFGTPAAQTVFNFSSKPRLPRQSRGSATGAAGLCVPPPSQPVSPDETPLGLVPRPPCAKEAGLRAVRARHSAQGHTTIVGPVMRRMSDALEYSRLFSAPCSAPCAAAAVGGTSACAGAVPAVDSACRRSPAAPEALL
eukprot:TRINITY_DN71674_c0_g1_i1.p1 TRINITY_DN71674_c0_g1~~TRINITY_DN71674_c0_g1_i1.p1  ORF type:complete len:326 (+),score=38.40 TRINITY_DN71674_c0_g1_i1:73-1050(+)